MSSRHREQGTGLQNGQHDHQLFQRDPSCNHIEEYHRPPKVLTRDIRDAYKTRVRTMSMGLFQLHEQKHRMEANSILSFAVCIVFDRESKMTMILVEIIYMELET